MKYLGVALIVLGALMCLLSEFVTDLKISQGNWYLSTTMVVFVVGIIVHVIVSKRY